ncbi:hypothetical protein NNRS527_00168 [Nitrosospira sp. NRS527]|nr:hypothetical protein NNRS527_00168 [Nitrosospira sp. NRS527]
MDQERFWRIAAYHASWKRLVLIWIKKLLEPGRMMLMRLFIFVRGMNA